MTLGKWTPEEVIKAEPQEFTVYEDYVIAVGTEEKPVVVEAECLKEALIADKGIRLKFARIEGSLQRPGTEIKQNVYFTQTRFSGKVDFRGAHFSGEGNFVSAQFSGYAYFSGTKFDTPANFARVRYKSNKFLQFRRQAPTEFYLDSQHIDEVSSPSFKRYVADQQFIRAFKEEHPILAGVWRWSSDYGRRATFD